MVPMATHNMYSTKYDKLLVISPTAKIRPLNLLKNAVCLVENVIITHKFNYLNKLKTL